MSELINTHDNRATIRWKLLTGASALALAAYVSSAGMVRAEDSGHSQIWIELGGEFTQLDNSQEPYLPPFVLSTPRIPAITVSPVGTEKNATFSLDSDAKISFQPAGSDWLFSARIQYGRDTKSKSLNQRTTEPNLYYYPYNRIILRYSAYQDLLARSAENHTILDFQAGKDVGLGKFGGNGSSAVNFGVRYAQFVSQNSVGIQYQPTNTGLAYFTHHRFYGSFAAKRSFKGVGPALSWDASAMIAGNRNDGGISLDWGANGAVLFGRQRIRGHRRTNDTFTSYQFGGVGFVKQIVYQTSSPLNRSKQVVVPNLGGFAGLSWRYAAAKVTLGYRADVFFNAIDGGIDARKSEDRAFYGPYASISIGLGD